MSSRITKPFLATKNTVNKLKKPQHQNGIVLVEFTIGILVLLFMILATAELGRVYLQYNILHKNVRTGARFLSQDALNNLSEIDLDDGRLADAYNLIIHGAVTGGDSRLEGFSAADIEVNEVTPSGAVLPYIEVLATYNYQPLFSSIPRFYGNQDLDFGFTLVSRVTMRAQQ